jgi:hypothetical protein
MGTKVYHAFARAVSNQCDFELSQINTVGLPSAFEALRAGIKGISLPPKHLTLPAKIELIREGAPDLEPFFPIEHTSDDLVQLLRDDFENREHDIVLSSIRMISLASRAIRHQSKGKEIARLKGDRTRRYEIEQLKKREPPLE